WGEPSWVSAAEDAARFVLRANRSTDGVLVRSSLDGIASSAVATLADLGLFAEGLLALAAATGDASWAVQGRDPLDDALSGGAQVGPVLTAQGVALAPDSTDGDLPSGASAIAHAALSVGRLGGGERY